MPEDLILTVDEEFLMNKDCPRGRELGPTIMKFRGEILSLLARAAEGSRMVINLKNVLYADRCAIEQILLVYLRGQKKNVSVFVENASTEVDRSIRQFHFDQFFYRPSESVATNPA